MKNRDFLFLCTSRIENCDGEGEGNVNIEEIFKKVWLVNKTWLHDFPARVFRWRHAEKLTEIRSFMDIRGS